MRKVFWLLLIAVAVAGAIWYGRRVAEKNATVGVTSLLPAETLFLAHLPDFNRTREQWHQTDIYKIREEPAVRDFLQKPLLRLPKAERVSQNIAQFEKLEPKDVFFAVTSWSNGIKAAGGFRFKGAAEEAERFIEPLREKLLANSPEATTEKITYEGHNIQSMTAKGQTLASVYSEHWFFIANDVAELKLILDRSDGRRKDRSKTLTGDAMFVGAFKHIPSSYAAMVYGRLDRYIERIMPLLGNSAAASGSQPIYRQIHAFCGAFRFDGGKIRDTFFLGMPELTNAGTLTRSSLALGTKESFLYLATLLNLPNEMTTPPPGSVNAAMPGILQKFVSGISNSGLTLEQWNAAFGAELGVIGDWPNGAQWPSLIATVPVKDSAKASEVFTRMATGPDGSPVIEEKEGARFFTVRNGSGPFSLSPTVALSSKHLIAGSTSSAVEAAVKRNATEDSELASSETFRAAEHEVPAAKHGFFYLDTALLYTRLDAALRPLLLMGAAFISSIGENVDLNKLPPAEVIARHLSPIVLSQNYENDGYVTESVGPVTFYDAAATAALLSGGAMFSYQQQIHKPNPLGGLLPSPSASPSAAPTATPSPAGTP